MARRRRELQVPERLWGPVVFLRAKGGPATNDGLADIGRFGIPVAVDADDRRKCELGADSGVFEGIAGWGEGRLGATPSVGSSDSPHDRDPSRDFGLRRTSFLRSLGSRRASVSNRGPFVGSGPNRGRAPSLRDEPLGSPG